MAHGNNVEEYLDCYTQLKQMGFKYVAVGGLLQRRKNTVRYPYVRNQDLMFQVLGALRQRYPDDWLFALGSFHPSRVSAFSRLHVWADYKGWIFQYKKQNETLDTHLDVFASNHLRHVKTPEAAEYVSTLRRMITQRAKVAAEHQLLYQKLYDGRRTLRAALASLYQELVEQRPEMAARFRDLTTHGLLSDTEEKLVNETIHSLGKRDSEEENRILENIRTNRELRGQIDSIEVRIDQDNTLLARSILNLKASRIQLPEDTRQLCITIASLIEGTKREHRFNPTTLFILDLIGRPL